MKSSILKGFSFGLTSGIITTLGLIVGLNSSTGSKMVVISGILIIAISDAMSDAFGIHISEESQGRRTVRQIWESTIATFVAKFLFALTFIVPILLFSLKVGVAVNIVWGLSMIALFSFQINKKDNGKAAEAVVEHLTIAVLVIVITNYVGRLIKSFQ